VNRLSRWLSIYPITSKFGSMGSQYIRKIEKYVAELSDIVKFDHEMIEFEFQKTQASNTLDRTHCQAFIMS
jgi:hypothetical protein